MFKIERSKLTELYDKISDNMDLFVPIRTAGQTNFAVYNASCNDAAKKEGFPVDVDTLKTVKSPKDVFFPQCENLYECVTDNGKISIKPEERCSREFVVLGVKGCDVRGFEILDKVFLADPVDSFYAARREHGTVVSMACGAPETSCFCKSFGIDAANPEGDVVTWMIEDNLYWSPVTEKGRKLTELVKDCLTDADGDADIEVVSEKQDEIRGIVGRLPYMDISLEDWGGDQTEEKFDSQLWDQLYKPCLACGTCTFVCPTCQCYDIKDYTTGKGVQRFRCWDSCMYSDFTMMAHGNNRTSQMQRFRQRFMHKLVYFPANNDGVFSCVGCGRCVDKCPASLNILKVIKAFRKKEANK